MVTPKGGWIIFVLGLLLAAPGAQADRPDTAKKPGKDKHSAELIKEGKVRVVRGIKGASPQLTDDSNRDWFLEGPLRGELLRLSGHRVQVWATADKKKLATPVLQVKRYEIRDSGGRKPLVGVLQQSDAREFILQQEQGTIRITGRPTFLKRLEKRLGCKISDRGEPGGEGPQRLQVRLAEMRQ